MLKDIGFTLSSRRTRSAQIPQGALCLDETPPLNAGGHGTIDTPEESETCESVSSTFEC